MLTVIRQYLSPPVLNDVEQNRAAELLNWVLVATLGIALVFQLIWQALLPNPWPLWLVSGAIVLVVSVSRYLMHDGRVRLAIWVFASSLWTISVLSAYMIGGGATGPLFNGVVLVILVAGLLTEWRAAIGFAVLSSIAGSILLFLESLGLVPDPLLSTTPALVLSNRIVFFSAATLLVYVATRSLSEALSGAHSNVRELVEINRGLEQTRSSLERQVADRLRLFEASAQVSRRLSTLMEQEDLVSQVVAQIQSVFNYYHVQIYLFNDAGEYLDMVGGTGGAGRALLAKRHRIPLGVGLVGRAAASNRVVLVPDVRLDPGWLSNPLLPETRAEVAVPIVLGNEVGGVIDVQHNVVGSIGEQDAELLVAIADQVAIALKNTHLFQEVQAALRQVEALNYRLTRQAWQDVSRYVTSTGYVFARSEIAPASPSKAWTATMSEALRSRALFLAPNEEVGDEGDLPEHRLAIPLTVGGQVIGVIGIDRAGSDRDWTPDELLAVQTISDQVALALDAARLTRVTEETAWRDRLIGDVTRQVWSEADLEQMMHAAVTKLGQELNASEVTLQLDSDGETSGTEGVAATATGARRGEDTGLPSLSRSGPQPGSQKQLAPDAVVAADLTIPLKLRGQMIGSLRVRRQNKKRWTAAEIGALETIAEQIALAIENARLHADERRTAVQLRETDRLKSEFLTTMSHELRTPLNSIIGFSEVLLEGLDGELSDNATVDVTAIHTSGQHLLTLINDILDLAKIEAGRMELIRRPVALSTIMEAVKSTAASLLKDKAVDLIISDLDHLPLVSVDETRMHQIILNLVSNAIKFTTQGQVKVDVRRQDEVIIVSVEDTGAGIPEKSSEVIFERFRQVDGATTRRAGGTGLGLTITQHLVEMHGGEIWVDSKEGVGSTFYFTIPLDDQSQTPVETKVAKNLSE
jgi:signal transduction histidine kinase